jgi:putative NADH-flavin reductase
MRLVVFGATGGTGRNVVEQALEAGHEVSAVARKPHALTIFHERLEVVRGDVMDLDSIRQAVVGKDAVISVLGVPYSHELITVYSAGVRNILRAMESAGVGRFVGVSAGGFVDDPKNDTLVIRYIVKPILKGILRHSYADMALMEEEVKRSGRKWTIVRPARLTDGSHTGRYRTAIDGSVPGGWSISRADVADFIVTHLDDPTVFGAAVGIAY